MIRKTLLLAVASFALLGVARGQEPKERVGPTPLTVAGLPPKSPLSVKARATPEALVLEVTLEEGWHLYARDVGGGRPVSVELLPESAFVSAGPLETPADHAGRIAGTAALRQPLARQGTSSLIKARFRFMACDALSCLPPMEALIEGRVDPVPLTSDAASVLLVAVANDDRAARIATFLKESGFRPAITTYETVTKEACDANDVVIADSPYFGKVKGARKHALKFPETASPLVAVGYLGTVVLEEHKVTMACGYI